MFRLLRNRRKKNTPLPYFKSPSEPANVHQAASNAREPPQRTGARGGDATGAARMALGLQADPPEIAKKMDHHMMWNRIRLILREPILEFFGVFIYVLFGDSVIAQWKLTNGEYGSWVSVCFGWTVGIMFGIYVAGDSGAYLNPAITLTNCLFRGIALRRFPIYAAAQFLGAFAAHALTYANYYSAIDEFEGYGVRTIPPGNTSTAGIFCTFPAGYFVPKRSQICSELIAQFVTIFCIFGLRDENGADMKGGGGDFTFAYGWLNFGLFSSFGWLTGSPINPGRDLAGRIWITIVGYKGQWTAFETWSWTPIVIPFFGCILGAIVYDVFIYTGESPINTKGFGLRGSWDSLFCGSSRWDEMQHEKEIEHSTSTGATRVSDSRSGRPTDDMGGSLRAKNKTHDTENSGYDDARDPENADLEFKESKNISYDNHSKNTGYDSSPRKERRPPRESGDEAISPR